MNDFFFLSIAKFLHKAPYILSFLNSKHFSLKSQQLDIISLQHAAQALNLIGGSFESFAVSTVGVITDKSPINRVKSGERQLLWQVETTAYTNTSS